MGNNKWFDTHAHYDHPLFAGLGPKIVRGLLAQGLSKVVIPAITFDSNFTAREEFLAGEFPDVFFAAGLHPKCATNEEDWSSEKKSAFESLLRDGRTVAVKSGLDYSKKKLQDAQKERQVRFFQMMIDYANGSRLPMVLHIREAVESAVLVMTQRAIENGAVAHCFTYDYDTARQLQGCGVTYFGIGGAVTREGMDELRECVAYLPLECLLLETDAPFVKPEGWEERLNDSRAIIPVAGKIAKLKSIPVEEVLRVCNMNASRFYGVTYDKY